MADTSLPLDVESSEPADDESLAFRLGPMVFAAPPDPNVDPDLNQPDYMYGEHSYLGDSIMLKDETEKPYRALDRPFTLPNKVMLTYGQINALAGDFFGTDQPISDGNSDKAKRDRFLLAFNTLATDTKRTPGEVKFFVKTLDDEIQAIKKALKDGKDPSEEYSKLPHHERELDKETHGRVKPSLTLYDLAKINWDHFGADARTAYTAGHSVALDTAKGGDLQLAYCMNAFADHFLEDSFAAGHIRTPRRALHGNFKYSPYDGLAKAMHDEDNAIGLTVRNANGDRWTALGDQRLLDHEGEAGQQICQKPVQASADEIFRAWKDKKVPDASQYAAVRMFPNLDGTQKLAALFVMQSELVRRAHIKQRRVAEYIKKWDPALTLAEIVSSGWWRYPIRIDGPKH